MSANEPESKDTGVTVSDWQACLNSGNGEIILSCTVSTNDSSAAITGVGLILNNSEGLTLATCYSGLSNGSESASPAINLAQGGLNVGDQVIGTATGEAHGQHYFFEKELVIGNC